MEHGTEDAMMEKQGLSIVDASQEGATMIMVTGNTDKTNSTKHYHSYSAKVIVSVDQISPNADGTFTIEMQVGGIWMYTISAQQGSGPYTDEVMIEINGAVVPEFGSTAIIVLVVAIVSITFLDASTMLRPCFSIIDIFSTVFHIVSHVMFHFFCIFVCTFKVKQTNNLAICCLNFCGGLICTLSYCNCVYSIFCPIRTSNFERCGMS